MTNTKKCPCCGEKIKFEAIKCKYCKEFIEETEGLIELKLNNMVFENFKNKESDLYQTFQKSICDSLGNGTISLINERQKLFYIYANYLYYYDKSAKFSYNEGALHPKKITSLYFEKYKYYFELTLAVLYEFFESMAFYFSDEIDGIKKEDRGFQFLSFIKKIKKIKGEIDEFDIINEEINKIKKTELIKLRGDITHRQSYFTDEYKKWLFSDYSKDNKCKIKEQRSKYHASLYTVIWSANIICKNLFELSLD